jgi:cytochrome P450
MHATPSSSSMTVLPDHVPPELVYDFDYVNDAGLHEDPHLRMRSIVREAPPIFYAPYYCGHWVITRRQALADITRDTATFSNKSKGIPATPKEIHLIPLTMDPPVHTVYRLPLNRHLSIKAVAPLETAIRAMSNELIDAVIDARTGDFLSQVAEPLPVTLFMRMAGMPTDRFHEFRKLAEDATAAPDGLVRQRALQSIHAILSDVVKARMATPEDDLLSRVLEADIDGRPPTYEEMQSYAVLLFLGGLETVVNAIGFSVRHLARNEALQTQLRDDPARIPAAVEEFLRLYGIASTIRRVITDTTYDGVNFKENDYILLLIPAVNYDPATYADAESFCPGRATGHVTFNMGPHRCVGANLARLELRVFLEEWLRRIPRFRLDPQRPPTFMGGLNLAVRTLPLIW